MAADAIATPKRMTAQTSNTNAIVSNGQAVPTSLSNSMQAAQPSNATHQIATSARRPRSAWEIGGIATSSGTKITVPATPSAHHRPSADRNAPVRTGVAPAAFVIIATSAGFNSPGLKD